MVWTHTWFCFTTTFERISPDEATTAAHVSSAEDSRARTVKCLRCRRAIASRLIAAEIIVAVRRPSPLPRVQVTTTFKAKLHRCSQRSYPPAPVHLRGAPPSSYLVRVHMANTPEGTLSFARTPAHPRPPSRPVRAAARRHPRSTHLRQRYGTLSPPVDLPPVSTSCDGCHHSASGPSQIRYAGAVRSLPFFGCILTTLL